MYHPWVLSFIILKYLNAEDMVILAYATIHNNYDVLKPYICTLNKIENTKINTMSVIRLHLTSHSEVSEVPNN